MAVQSLGELLFATQADGSRLYTDADLADALPLLVFMLQLPIDTLPKPVSAYQSGASRGTNGLTAVFTRPWMM